MSDLKLSPDVVQGCLTHVDATDDQVVVWAQMDMAAVVKQEMKMSLHYQFMFDKYYRPSMHPTITQLVPLTGKYYIFGDKSNHNFYRVLIKRVDPMARQSVVSFIDFGYEESVHNSCLMVYEDLFDSKPLAEPFVLHGIQPKDPQRGWNREKVKQCLDQFCSSVFWFTICEMMSQRVVKVYDNNRHEILVNTLKDEYFDDDLIAGDNGSTPTLIAIDYKNRPQTTSQSSIEMTMDQTIDSRLGSALNFSQHFSTSTISLISDFSPKNSNPMDETVEETIDVPKDNVPLFVDRVHQIANPSKRVVKIDSQDLITGQQLDNGIDYEVDECSDNRNQLDREINDDIQELENTLKSITGEDSIKDMPSDADNTYGNELNGNSLNNSLNDGYRGDNEAEDPVVSAKPVDVTQQVPSGDTTVQMSDLEEVALEKMYSLCQTAKQVKISSAENSTSIYVQLDEHNETLEALVDDMTDYYTNITDLEISGSDVRDVVMNRGLLAVYNSLESKWMRAMVCGKPNENQLNVFYVDFGAKETVELEACCHLLEHYSHLIPHAIHCRPINERVSYYVLKRLESKEEVIDVVFGKVLDNSVIEVLLNDKCLK
ncbi:unnamed protein product [Oppiella nova]|uniref:Tudor domain-containing protein n=1 Tax=Oppiella nova TaxID=334625 RepID=A0A7R9LFL4_9ACAR|nr:unnamed protein product [Oppiella nova]CAG2162453.1 unnamed protein product [Oppiella nova]